MVSKWIEVDTRRSLNATISEGSGFCAIYIPPQCPPVKSGEWLVKHAKPSFNKIFRATSWSLNDNNQRLRYLLTPGTVKLSPNISWNLFTGWPKRFNIGALIKLMIRLIKAHFVPPQDPMKELKSFHPSGQPEASMASVAQGSQWTDYNIASKCLPLCGVTHLIIWLKVCDWP